MPNADEKKQGTPLKERVKDAAKLTAEQQQERSGTGKDKSAKKSKKKPTTRKATQELKTKEKDAKEQKEKESSSGSESSSTKEKKPSKKRSQADVAKLKRRLKRVGIVVGIIVILVAIMYPVGRNYYSMKRQEQRLEAELAAIEERNAEIEAQNNELGTDEGVENQAREDLGWVQEGDQAAVVTNIEDEDTEGALPPQINPEDVHAPQTWYYRILDTIFFVHE